MTNQRPRIVFDEEGVCSACRYHERQENEIDWEERGQELANLLGSVGANKVVVPCSGGKDSSFVASTLRDYGMNPLCACWAPHVYTDIGIKNMQSFIHSGFDVVTAQPNGLLHRKLSRLGLEFYGDNFLPFIYGQLCWPMHVAVQNDIPLVFGGENGEALYGGDPSANDKHGWDVDDWERIYQKGGAVRKLIALGRVLGAITEQEELGLSLFYEMPDLVRPGRLLPEPEYHWLSYYKPWKPQSNYYDACERTGFEANEERSQGTYSKYASLDDKLDGLHYFLGFLKFGIGRCTSDAAHEVRDGELTREEALALVEKYDGEFPERHLDECLDYLGMDREQLDRVCARFQNHS
jgi:N-acetyl sugar amidotransferase